MVSYREAIAIAQIIFFVPSLIGGILLCLRHGFSKSSGWVLLITFSLLRLIGAILEIVGIIHPSRQVITGAIVCISIGISPLTLICLGLLARVNQAAGVLIPKMVFRVLSLISLVGLSLGINGGIRASSVTQSDYTQVNIYSKIAILLFTGIFIIAFFMFLFLATRQSEVPAGEKRLLLAVALSCPFLAVRFTYSLLADFAHDKRFSSFFGSATIYLCMAVLMEFAVVLICQSTGLTLRKLPKDQETGDVEMRRNPEIESGHVQVGSMDSTADNENARLSTGQRAQKPKRPFKGPISWVYFKVADSIAEKRERR